jgi:hypothetical protein
LDQSFSERSLWKTLRKGDAQKYNLGKDRTEIKDSLKEIENRVNSPDFSFSSFNTQIRNKFKVFTTTTCTDELLLRKVADNLKRALGIKPADRNELVPQAIRLAREARDCTIYKFDISSFFESIDRATLIDGLSADKTLSGQTVSIIKKLFEAPQVASCTGLPRGLSVSPILAEFYLQGLENRCRQLTYCYYYTRYVDDMLFFCHANSNNIEADITNALPKGLVINAGKTRKITLDRHGHLVNDSQAAKSICYLGYEILFPSARPNKVSVSIPASKIAKIKTRIAISVMRFIADQDYPKLLLRIRFLTCNFKIGGSKQTGILYSGIHYNHQYIDETHAEVVFSDLDQFLQKLIYSKSGTLGRRLHPLLDNKRRKQLCGHSFLQGHKAPIYRDLKNEELGEAKEAWEHA